jgi:hypothetical protein
MTGALEDGQADITGNRTCVRFSISSISICTALRSGADRSGGETITALFNSSAWVRVDTMAMARAINTVAAKYPVRVITDVLEMLKWAVGMGLLGVPLPGQVGCVVESWTLFTKRSIQILSGQARKKSCAFVLAKITGSDLP